MSTDTDTIRADAYEALCYYDPRNPHAVLDEDEVREPAQKGCACDSCFYQRDPLARHLLEFADVIDRLREHL